MHETSVVIASFRSRSEERVALEDLAAEGIAAESGDDPMLGGGWRCISVGPADAERALTILRRLWPAEAERVQEAAPERCPACGSPEVRRFRRLPVLVVATIVLLAAGAATGQSALFGLTLAIVAVALLAVPNRRCPACGERWQEPGRAVVEEAAVETPGVPCPRCGSDDTFSIDRRRLRAITLLVNLALPPLVVLWPFLPARRCGQCGHEWR